MTRELPPLSSTVRSTPTRKAYRSSAHRPVLHEILDAGLICHLGLLMHGSPVVLPTGYGRDGDTLYVHGSSGAGNLRAGGDADVCVTVTLLDGIVYARSLNNHSMNYRSAVVHGRASVVTDPAAKRHALHVITDRLSPGSWGYARAVSDKELAAVRVLALDLAEASVKTRVGGPSEEPEDVDRDETWAGVLPLRTVFGAVETADYVPAGMAPPAHVSERAGTVLAPAAD